MRDCVADHNVLGVSASDPCQVITVTVGDGGKLENVHIGDAAYSTYSPGELAAAITDTYDEAVEALREEVVSHFHDLLGIRLSPSEVASGQTRMDNLLRKLASAPAVRLFRYQPIPIYFAKHSTTAPTVSLSDICPLNTPSVY